MKKMILFGFGFIAMALLIVSCQKEELNSVPDSSSQAQVHNEFDGAAATTLPDLIITQFTTNVTAKTSRCNIAIQDTIFPIGQHGQRIATEGDSGVEPLIIRPASLSCPNVSCFGGQRFFMATVTIQNIGAVDLPPGSISVAWTDITTSSTQVQTVPHNGIAVGETFNVTRPYYMGPCDCPPPATFFKHLFKATVDPANAIAELNETNNTSKVWRACDGC